MFYLPPIRVDALSAGVLLRSEGGTTLPLPDRGPGLLGMGPLKQFQLVQLGYCRVIVDADYCWPTFRATDSLVFGRSHQTAVPVGGGSSA